MNEPEKPKKGWGCLQWVVVILVLLLLTSLWWAFHAVTKDIADHSSVSKNSRQIMMAMRIWALENDGAYPDSAFQERPTANQVFRKLIHEGIQEDERIFGAKKSFFVPDGKIGVAPTFDEAVKPGENHWMITAGQNSKSSGEVPLVFENAITSTWPLRWQHGHENELIRGRTWTSGKIIIGFQDNHVQVIQLEKQGDVMVLPGTVMIPNGKTPLPPLKILDIE